MTDPKQAAERLKPYIDSDWPASMWAQFESDCHTLARAYLAEHADDDVQLDPDWLDTQECDCAYWPVGDGRLEFTEVGESTVEPGFKLRTRGDFRLLQRLIATTTRGAADE